MWSRYLERWVNLVLLAWNAIWAIEPSPIIQTTDGPVQGGIKYSRDNQKYFQFLGIPFAKPPVGSLKFLPPEPPEPWTEVRQANKYSSMCVQFDLVRLRSLGDFDCLYLNVFVNVASGYVNASKPVIFWIHGGAFLTGEGGTYQPEYFMDQEVVLVVINYRLGPYGFLNLQEETGPKGNQALFDVVMALKWVQKNIANFGGDPNRTTIMGESAGAIMSHFLVLSPYGKGLFQKAVLQSGSALAPFSFSEFPRNIAEGYAKKVGCPVGNFSLLLKCYENTDWWDLVKHQHTLLLPLIPKDLFEPSVDGELVTEIPQDTLLSGNFPPIPLMIGVNSGEGTIRSARFEALPELIEELEQDWLNLANNLAVLETPLDHDTALKVRRQYFGNATFTPQIANWFRRVLTDLVSEAGFFYPAHRTGVEHARKGAPVYMYYFNYTSRIFPGIYSAFKSIQLDDFVPSEVRFVSATVMDWIREYIFGRPGSRPYGINHGDDTFQLFNLEGLMKFVSHLDADFSRGFVKAIVDFANDTQPLTFRGTQWPTINEALDSGKDEFEIPYMLLDNKPKPEVVPEPFGDAIKFWAQLENWYY